MINHVFYLLRLHRLSLAISISILLATLAFSPSVFGYHYFYVSSGGSFLPVKWRTLPVNFLVDNGPTDILPEIQTAVDTWNNVSTAQNVLGTLTRAKGNFTGANFMSAWGNLNADGQQEVVLDEDGTALAAVGLDPSSVNGFGPTRKEISGGQAAITDAYLLLNGTRTNFDRRSTGVHEFGHIQGLAHSSVGMHNSASFPSDALDPINIGSVPTMHPFSTNTGTARRTLETDDIAALSELYPDGSFATAFGSIEGTVTRCFSTDGVTGANVRAINTSNPNVQVSRFTGFDGNNQGRFIINGLPPGSYRLVVEPLGANDFNLPRFGRPPTRQEQDFPTEYYNPPEEDTCSEEVPDMPVNISVGAGAAANNQNFKVGGVDLAFVVDDTGSMFNEIAGVRTGLSRFITILENLNQTLGTPFPSVAIVTFKDDVTKRLVSKDPARLQAVVNSLTASGGGDCPESSNAALLTAGRLLKQGGLIPGVALLFTDADSRPDGPDRATVNNLYRSKGARVFTLLSATCSGGISAPGLGDLSPERPQTDIPMSSNLDEFPLPATLGFENPVRTFSEISIETGGFFTVIPGIRTGNPVEVERYVNTVTNLAVSSAVPAVGLVTPGDGPQGNSMNLEIFGSNTNFQSSSALTFSGGGITVNSLTVVSPVKIQANISIAPGATLGFRDVMITTNLGASTIETAKGIGAFQVVSPPAFPTITGAAPSLGAQGQTLNVSISGANTSFVNGVSTASFGSGITVNSTTVLNSTSAVANITISDTATIGFRDVFVTTNSEIATENIVGPFFVSAPPPAIPRIVLVNPPEGLRGQTLELTVTGENTNFSEDSVISFSGTGITINNTTVNSATSLTANITIAPNAPLGFQDVSVTTESEVATILRGFQVREIPFDICLQGDGNANKLQINSATGAYQWTNCVGLSMSGAGVVRIKGSLMTVQHNAPDRRLLVTIDRNARSATASLQVFALGNTFNIMDRDTTNNHCGCP